MRKLSLLIAPAFVALLVASACGDGGQPATTPPLTATTAPTEDATPEPGVSAAGRIAFVSRGDGNGIYIMNADGSGLTRLTNDPGDDRDPAWMPAPKG